ncbi:hypothetical protein RRG08_034796 [Elysia crispata]|uniref:Uncharacterized protein n=1 Tax=Elysia crispata TaxID=231223 RepID=A0AAE0YA76_9GAST|nr:hypothetical protein RRG08_034796 [Elysia crispata]
MSTGTCDPLALKRCHEPATVRAWPRLGERTVGEDSEHSCSADRDLVRAEWRQAEEARRSAYEIKIWPEGGDLWMVNDADGKTRPRGEQQKVAGFRKLYSESIERAERRLVLVITVMERRIKGKEDKSLMNQITSTSRVTRGAHEKVPQTSDKHIHILLFSDVQEKDGQQLTRVMVALWPGQEAIVRTSGTIPSPGAAQGLGPNNQQHLSERAFVLGKARQLPAHQP